VGKAKIFQRDFSLYNEKSRINRILGLALNVVQYYNVRLKVIANIAAATFAGSEERKQCRNVTIKSQFAHKFNYLSHSSLQFFIFNIS